MSPSLPEGIRSSKSAAASPASPSRIDELSTIPSAAWTESKTLALTARISLGSVARTISAERSISRRPAWAA